MCASSIGSEKGVVNLYDSLFYVILDDLQQVENVVGEDFREINVVPIQLRSWCICNCFCNKSCLHIGSKYTSI